MHFKEKFIHIPIFSMGRFGARCQQSESDACKWTHRPNTIIAQLVFINSTVNELKSNTTMVLSNTNHTNERRRHLGNISDGHNGLHVFLRNLKMNNFDRLPSVRQALGHQAAVTKIRDSFTAQQAAAFFFKQSTVQ